MTKDVSKISLLLPTRGRPALVQRLFRSIAEQTADLVNIEIILYVDEDDTESHNLAFDNLNITKIIGSRLSMGAYNSACLSRSIGDIIILVNDDMVIRTTGWDKIIRDFDVDVKDQIYLAYGNDMFKKGKLCTFPILSRKTCEILLKPYPEEYRGAFIDCHIFDIFKRLEHAGYHRIFYIDSIVFEHLHYRTGKAEYDTTYSERGRFDDDAVFISLRNLRQESALRLLASIRGEPLTALHSINAQKTNSINSVSTIMKFFMIFLMDRGLPFRWRTYLFIWFCGRNLVSKGYLPWLE